MSRRCDTHAHRWTFTSCGLNQAVNLLAGVSNVPGGSIAEVARLGGFRFLAALGLATRQSSLVNLPSTPGVPFPFNLNFNENLQLRDLPALVTTVPGAQAIDVVLDHTQWVTQAANPVSYAPFIRKQPLAGHAPKPVIMQFAKGDNTVPNPTTSAILLAGGLADRATYYRNDLAYQANPAVGKNPHVFLTNVGSQPLWATRWRRSDESRLSSPAAG
ncbi:MAG: hypothetical protein H7238_02420 [Polaromonas sp.]|nr:hypothetical protein [Polaromonas sp.]